MKTQVETLASYKLTLELLLRFVQYSSFEPSLAVFVKLQPCYKKAHDSYERRNNDKNWMYPLVETELIQCLALSLCFLHDCLRFMKSVPSMIRAYKNISLEKKIHTHTHKHTVTYVFDFLNTWGNCNDSKIDCYKPGLVVSTPFLSRGVQQKLDSSSRSIPATNSFPAGSTNPCSLYSLNYDL